MANGNDNDLGVLIGFWLDEVKETRDINEAIKRIESKLDKLNIQINIDTDALKSLQDSIRSIDRIGNESFKQLSQETLKATQASEEHERQLREEAQAVRELARDAENLRKKIITLAGDGKTIKQEQIITGDKFNSKTVIRKPQEDGSIITTGIIEAFDKEKLDEARKYYEDFVNDFTRRIGQVEDALGPTNEKIRNLVKSFEQLNERSSRTDFKRIERELKDLEKEAKNYYDMLKLEDRAWRENQKRDEDFLQRRKKLEIDIADIRRRFGADQNVVKNLEQLEKSLYSVSKIGNYQQAFADINTELKNIKANAKTATSHIIGFGEALSTAFTKFSIWLASGTVIMQTLRFFEYGLRYTVELDSKLNEIAIVLGKNQDQVRGLAKEYNELAKQMSVTTREIANASVEFYRQGLSQEEVMQRLKTTTQYAKISSLEFKDAAEILTATVNSMGVDIERAADIFAYLGDRTATGADEIGIAFQRVGGTAGALNLEFEKVSSWIAVLSSRTRESAATIGNSIKSILARVQSLKEYGFVEEDGTRVNQVAKALAEVGIQLMDARGQFRNFGVVMDELGAKWDSLDSRQRAYLATTIAGTYQQSRFLNLMQGYKDTIPLYEEALDAAGTTQNKYNIYLQSTQAHIDKLKATMEGLWNSSFHSNEINSIIDSITVLISVVSNLTETFGFLPTTLGFGITALKLFNGSAKNLAESVGFINKIFPISKVAIEKFSMSVTGSTAATRALTTAIYGLATSFRSLLVATGIGAVFAVASFAIEKIISSITKASQAHKEYVENLKSTITETEEQIKKIEELYEKYTNFNGTQEEYNSLLNEMASVMPELIDHYNAEGKAILKTKEEIEELIEAKKRYNLENQKTLYYEETNALEDSTKAIEENIKTREKAQKEFDYLAARFESLQFAEKFINENDLDNIDKNSKEYIEKITYLQDKIKRIFSEKGLFVSDTFLSGEILTHKGLYNAVIAADEELKKYQGIINSANDKINQEKQKFEKHLQDYNDIIVNSANISDRNVKKLLDNYAGVFIDTSNITKDNFKQIVYDYQQFADNVIKYIEENKINVTELIEKGDNQALVNILSAVGSESNRAAQAISKFTFSLKDNSEEILNNEKNFEEHSDIYKNVANDIKEINNVLNDLSKGQSLTADTVADLLVKYPQLASSIKKVSDGWTIEKEGLEELRKAKIKEAEDSNQAQIESKKVTLQQVYQRIEAFGLEIQAIKDLQSAYKEISKLGFVKVFGQDIFEDGKVEFDPEKLQIKIGDSIAQYSKEDYEKIKKAYEDQKEAYELTLDFGKLQESKSKLLDMLSDPNFGVSISKSKSGSSKNPLEEAYRKDLEAFEQYADLFELSAYERILGIEKIRKKHAAFLANSKKDEMDLLLKLKSLHEENTRDWLGKQSKVYQEFEKQIVQSERLQMHMEENTPEWTREIEKQIEIRRKWQEQLHKDNEALRARLEADKTANKENKLTKQQIEDITRRIEENSNAWWELEEAILNASKQLAEFRENNADDIINNYKKMLEQQRDIELDYIEERIRLEEERHDKVMDNLDEELDQFKEIIDARLKALERANEEEDYQRELQKLLDERAKIQEQYNTLLKDNSYEAKARRAELQKQLIEKDEEIARLQRERERDLSRQALEDQLADREKYIEEQKDLENEKYKYNKDLLEKEKRDRENYWKSILEDEQRFYTMKQQLMSQDRNQVLGIIAQIRAEYEKFFAYLETKSSFLGSMFSTISNNMKGHLDAIDNYTKQPSQSKPSGNNYSDSQKAVLDQAWAEYLSNKQKAEALYAEIRSGKLSSSQEQAKRAEIDRLRSINDNYRSKYGFPEGSYEQVKNLKPFSAETGGMTPAWGPEGKWLLAHEKELILNKHDTANMLKIVDITRSIVDSIKNINLSNLIKPVQLSTPSGTIIEKLEVNISGNFNQKNGDDVFESLMDGLNRKGIRLGRRF